MYTKIIQNTKFVYILYTKTVQIKILYDHECTRHVHLISTYMQKMYKLYKTCRKLKLKVIESYMRLSIYVFCININSTVLFVFSY